MNQSFNNEQAPQTPQAPASPSPFEQTQNQPPVQQPATAPQGQGGNQPGGFEPTGMEPMSSPKSSWGLIIALVVVLFLGVLFFASWQGWISLGGIEKLWKKSDTTTTSTPVATDATNANDTTRKKDLVDLKAALKKYYQAQQSYPVAATSQKTSDATSALSVLVPTYIAELPIDPLSPTYYYGYKSDGKTFELTTVLEDKTTAGGTQVGTLYIYKVTDTSVETPAAASSTDTTTTTGTGTTDTTTTTGTDTTDTTTPSTTTTTTTTPSTTSGSATGSGSATTTTN